MAAHKNLVFHFHTFKGFEDNEAIRLHLKCLKKYSGVFDNALFVMSAEDPDDVETIKAAEKAIIDCGFRNVAFKVDKNDYYCEAKTFKEEVIDKIDSFDGLVFFGHTKGVTNVKNPSISKVSVLRWVAAMYYLNLTFIDDVEKCLINKFNYSFYGAYKVKSEKIENKNHTWYAGTFYWLNPNRLSNNMKQKNLTFPKLHDRGYAEFLTGEVDELGSRWDVVLYPFDYNTAGFLVNFQLFDDEKEIEKYEEYIASLDI